MSPLYLRYISATQVEEGDEPAIALYHKLGYTFVRREEGRRLVGDILFGKSVKVSRLRYEKTLAETLRFHQNSVGSVMGPFDSFLMLRGVKTLALRMRRHNETALALATWLEKHPKVGKIAYPGLESHPQHSIASKFMQLDGQPVGGGMITIVLDSDLAGCRRFLENLSVFTLAESLGGVESLVNHPAIMTHASVDPAVRQELGIEDCLVRLSVGIEDGRDLQKDLEKALDAV